MKAFIEQLERMGDALGDPEYLYLVIEPLLFYGIGFGIVFFIATFFLKAEKMQIAALAVIAASALSFVPYMKFRTDAQPRIESVYRVSSPARVTGFKANTLDRQEHRWIYIALAGAAGMAILVGPRRNKLGLMLAVSSVVLGLYAVNFSLWMHYQDALAYHPNLKSNDNAPVKVKIAEREREKVVKDAAPSEGAAKSRPVATPVNQVVGEEEIEPSPTERRIRQIRPIESLGAN